MKKTTTNQSLLNHSGKSRRAFVKNTALVSGGLMVSQLPVSQAAHVLGDDTIKVALVGCGGRGTGAAVQALSTEGKVKLVAMADAFQNRLDKSFKHITEKFGNSKKLKVSKDQQFIGFDAYKQAIDLADVVILATPPGFRPQHFAYAISNNKHVFMEKPVATDSPGVRKVLENAKIAKEKKLNVVVGLQRHYQNNYLKVIENIRSGAIGDIISGQVYWNGGGVWVRPREAGETEMQYQMKNWYYFNWLCGDHILEQHIHNIDVANWFINDYPTTAQGMGGRQVRKGKDHGHIFDHHFVEFTYPSGTIISSQCRHQPGTMSRVDEVFQGTKGTSYTNSSNKGRVKDYQGNTIYNHRGNKDPNPYQVEHDKLFSAIRNGDVISDAENGAKSTLAAIMGRMATYSGQVITWDQAMNFDSQLVPDNLSWDSDPPVMPDENGNYPVPVPGQFKIY